MNSVLYSQFKMKHILDLYNLSLALDCFITKNPQKGERTGSS